jgi:crotonobetainyl-CoA:carnitine CoA-transferase CaiB-like acyl-CoA transferase
VGIRVVNTRVSHAEIILHAVKHDVTPAEHPNFGKYWRPDLTVNFLSMPGRFAPPTVIGEYTRPLLAELGYSPTKIESLFAERIVR